MPQAGKLGLLYADQYLIKDLNNAETRGLNIALGKGKKVRGANNSKFYTYTTYFIFEFSRYW